MIYLSYFIFSFKNKIIDEQNKSGKLNSNPYDPQYLEI